MSVFRKEAPFTSILTVTLFFFFAIINFGIGGQTSPCDPQYTGDHSCHHIIEAAALGEARRLGETLLHLPHILRGDGQQIAGVHTKMRYLRTCVAGHDCATSMALSLRCRTTTLELPSAGAADVAAGDRTV
ncbi:hypothetical protein ACLKA6_012085 [Drosophila palustris]